MTNIIVEVFQIFVDVNDSFFIIWSSSTKNDFIAIILPHCLVSSESNFELNDELVTEFEWNGGVVQGVRNDPILGEATAGSGM